MKHPEILLGAKTVQLPEDPDHEYYIPGYLIQKVAFLILTAAIVLISLVDVVPKLWIMATGEFTRAEVVEVIRVEPDRSETRYTNDAEAREAYEDENRSPLFFNTLAYRFADGTLHQTRMPRGSRLQPPYSILDTSGLPSTVLIAARTSNPTSIVVPLSLSTWFFPAIIFMFGFSGLVVAGLYLWHAPRPIQVPNLKQENNANEH
jgi:hypothetical protein